MKRRLVEKLQKALTRARAVGEHPRTLFRIAARRYSRGLQPLRFVWFAERIRKKRAQQKADEVFYADYAKNHAAKNDLMIRSVYREVFTRMRHGQ